MGRLGKPLSDANNVSTWKTSLSLDKIKRFQPPLHLLMCQGINEKVISD